MQIFDIHIHAKGHKPNPEALLAEMAKAGVFGGCVFSTHPKENMMPGGLSFDERLDEALGWSRGYEDRLFPILWIHPYEENITENVRRAVKAGVAGFKMICSNYYVYEDKCIELLSEIARLGKPVFFHTGILWDGEISSEYNRPLNWEALLKIKGLRFSMGHCSWPWVDECIALYGKFLNTLTYSSDGAEMFFDTTPGTPEIYREELITKLYTVGYNVGDNVMFGTDCLASSYRSEWTGAWLSADKKILDKLGVSLENREKLFRGNLMRFLGKSETEVTKEAPVIDDTHIWTPESPKVRTVIEKWYGRLGFPKCYDKEFREALDRIKISDAITLDDYDKKCNDGKRNLLSFLYLCEEVERRYIELGIPDEILIDTLKDIPVWTKVWSSVKGELHLGELGWLSRHMSLRLFKLGRLQFSPSPAERDIPSYGIKKGEEVMEIHIPSGERLEPEECRRSIENAKEFFAKYFPNISYKHFTCHSWLLDDTLKKYLPGDSNIIRFGDMFDKIEEDDSCALIRYLFRWDTNEVNLRYAYPSSTLAEKVKRAVLHGETFHETLGVIEK